MTETNLKNLASTPLEFLTYTFYPKKGSIVMQDGQEVFMEPRLKDFFYFLLANKNDVSTREELMQFVWKNTVVTEDSISKAASDLRKFLTIHHIEGVTIETINKLGYIMRISETDHTLKKRRFSKKTLIKAMAYSFGILLFLVLLIRALRYEQ